VTQSFFNDEHHLIMTTTVADSESHDEWDSFLASTDDLTSSARGCSLCSASISLSTDWIASLIDEETKNPPSCAYCEKEFTDTLEDRRLEISNFDPDETTKEEVAAVCAHYGETAWIDMSEKRLGKITVKFYDLRAAYAMKLSFIRLRGLRWLVQFHKPESLENLEKCVNSGKISIVPLSDSITEEMIQEQFAQFGPIREVRRWKNHRFVEFWDERSCTKAIEVMHGAELFGGKISVKHSRPYFRHRLNAACRDERLPTVARASRMAKPTVQLEIPKTDGVEEKKRIFVNRENRKPAVVLKFSKT
jgi:RNA recognition motif-containing protein